MEQKAKICPQCQKNGKTVEMKQDKRRKFEGTTSAFVGPDYWVCPTCGYAEEMK